jgi:hypothetical protein
MKNAASPKIICELRGLKLHNFRFIEGGSLILYIGRVSKDNLLELTPWRLHIDSTWRLHNRRKLLLSSENVRFNEIDAKLRRLITKAFKSIIGAKIEGVVVGDPILDLTFSFEGGSTFNCFLDSNQKELFELRHEDGRRWLLENPFSLKQKKFASDNSTFRRRN